MSNSALIEDFILQNSVLIVAAIGLLGYLIHFEFKRRRFLGLVLGSTELTRRVNDGAKLIDVRGKDAYKAGHIVGAESIPVEQLTDKLEHTDKASPIVLYCQRGITSEKGLLTLKAQGFTQVTHLQGGLDQWTADGLPLHK